ncbi:MAG: SCP2 sterol-binding domain-containing protein [Thermodesulfobacteriota bacterium]
MDKDEIKEKLLSAAFKALRLPVKSTPLWIESIAMGVYITAVLESKPALKERIAELEGKTFKFEAIDVEKSFYMRIAGGRVNVIPHMKGPPDVTMRGKVRVLTGVLTGTIDPDTVFFSRELEINGDTAAGLHLKNILSSL